MHYAEAMAETSYNVRQDPSTYVYKPLRDSWSAPTGTMFSRPAPSIKTNVSINAMAFMDAYIAHASALAQEDLSGCLRQPFLPIDDAPSVPSALVNNSDWTFVMDNTRLNLLLSQIGVVVALGESHRYKVDTTMNLLTIIFICSCSIPLIITGIFVIPSFNSLKKEGSVVRHFFFKFDSHAIDAIIRHHKKAALAMDSLGDRSARTSKASLASSENSVDMADAGISNFAIIIKGPAHSRMLIVYFICVIGLLGLLAGTVVMVYNTSSFLRYSSDESSWNAARRSLGMRMVALSQELIRYDKTIWVDRDEIRSYLREHLALVSDMKICQHYF